MWIEDFRTLKNVNLNFHANFEFEFKLNSKDKNKGTLTVKKFKPEDNFIYEYFPENQFISLIVGKNGIGKTSIFDLLYEGVSTGNRYFLVFLENTEKENKLYIWGAKLSNFNENFVPLKNIKNLIELDLELPKKEQIENPAKRYNCYYFSKFPNLSLCYISSEFNKKEPLLTFVTFHKTSTFSSDATDFYKELKLIDSQQKDLYCLSKYNLTEQVVNTNFWVNFFKHIVFLKEVSKIDKNIKIPDILEFSLRELSFEEKNLKEYLRIEIPHNICSNEENLANFFKDIHQNVELKNNLCFETYLLKMIQLHREALRLYKKPQKEQYFLFFKLNSIIFHLFYTYEEFKDNSKIMNELCKRILNIKEKIEKIPNNNPLEKYVEILFDELKQKLIIVKNNQKIHYSFWSEYFEKIKTIEKILNKILNKDVKYKIYHDRITIKITENTINELEELANILKDMFFARFPLIFLDTIPPLSSGQKRLINLIEKIEELVNHTATNLKAEKNIILLLDEPDVYLHPEWQRLFIFFLTRFLEEKFSDKNFHTIITTHSPFLLSDIPKDNCIFLDLEINENKQEYKSVVKSKEKVSDTLAQNIYYLLADGFFMEKGVGEYINSKLKQFLEKINKGTLSFEEEQKFRYLIENIGDTVLRNKLLHILENKNFYKDKLKI